MGAETPYNGSSGWSGSETSKARADHDDSTGITSKRQQAVLRHLAIAGARGGTWREIGGVHGWHHGQVSGALSVLHKVGRIARLTEQRDGSAVYVLPDHTEGRDIAPVKPRRTYADGYSAGLEAGYADGYSDGYSDGLDASEGELL